jgi:uncharacterized membrane protein
MTYLKVLLVLHIGGAIIGIGPTYAFGVIGSMMPTAGPGAITLMEAMKKIDKVLVNPVTIFLQPVTGILLIAKLGLDKTFFENEWLWISILAYIIILGLAHGRMNPGLRKMIALAKEGKAQTPEFAALAKVQQTTGPILGILGILIIILMVWKPGAAPGL